MTLSLSSVVDDVSELFLWVDVVLVVTLPVAQVQSAEGVAFNRIIEPCPVFHTFYSHMVHQQILVSSALVQQHQVLSHGNQVLHVQLLHILLLVRYDCCLQDVQHAQARHHDHHQEQNIERS